MTEHNRIPARQIIVYGDCWPVTIAVAHLVRRFLPGCNCETAYRLPVLLQQLRVIAATEQAACMRFHSCSPAEIFGPGVPRRSSPASSHRKR